MALARALAGSAEGLTLDEMAQVLGAGRRTAERMRDQLLDLFPQMEVVPDPPTKRWRIGAGLDGFLQAPTADELAALSAAAAELDRSGAASRAAQLRALEAKVVSALRAPVRRRIAPDLEALLQAEAMAVQAGPRPYGGRGGAGGHPRGDQGRAGLELPLRGRFRTPGRLAAPSRRMVSCSPAPTTWWRRRATGEARNWRLDRLKDVQVAEAMALPPGGFSLQAYADRSFGIYQDAPEDVELLFAPSAAEAVLRWRFHIGQSAAEEAGGRVRVSFRASGMRELAWHLFTWGDAVEIVSPERLKAVLAEAIAAAARAHGVGRVG